MSKFKYKAKRGPTDVVEGTIVAESKTEAISRLSAEGYFPFFIEEISESVENKTRIFQKGVSQMDLALFTRQLVDLLEGGLTLYNALDTLARQTENKKFAVIIESLRDHIREGNTLSSGLSRYHKLFKPFYISMVKAGESGGILEDVLRRLAEIIEKDQELRGKVKGAFLYPVFLSLFGILTVSILVIFVIPKLAIVFEDFGQQLPLPTLVLISISNFISKWCWLLAIVIAGIMFIIYQEKKTPEGRLYLDTLKLKLPILGKLVMKAQLSQLARTLSSLLNSGIPAVQALEIVVETVENEVIKRRIEVVKENVAKGAKIGDAFSEQGFPELLVNMVNVGEKSGFIEKTLQKVSSTYETEVERYTRQFTVLLEPFLLLFMGIIVGFIVFSMLLPIFNLNLALR